MHHQQIVSDHQALLHVVDALRDHSLSQVDALRVSQGLVPERRKGEGEEGREKVEGGGSVVSLHVLISLSRIFVASISLECSICSDCWMKRASGCLGRPRSS